MRLTVHCKTILLLSFMLHCFIASLINDHLSFPYVCPEPVLVKRSLQYINGFQNDRYQATNLHLPRQARDRRHVTSRNVT
jgi:hypothetical protein